MKTSAEKSLRYKRVLLKLSGEVLGNKASGECLDPERLSFMAERVKAVRALGVETALVVGGGNIFRGLSGLSGGVDRTTGDSMGMLATVINALALSAALANAGVPSVVMTASPMPKFAALYGMPMEAIVGMGTKVNAHITSVSTLVLFAVVPFNLLKGVIVSALTFLLYKRISPLLHKGDERRAERKAKKA